MPWPMAPMGPPPARPHVAVARLRRPAAQLQRARDAPPRPELNDCNVCAQCKGGECARWRQLQREWVETWEGRPPPAEGSWANWWKAAKTHHAQLLAAADAQPPAPAAATSAAAAGKRLAQLDGTPNKGGARKNAPAVRDRGEGSSGVHSLLLPPSDDQTAEEAEVAEVLAVLDMADDADAAAEATAAAEAAEVA